MRTEAKERASPRADDPTGRLSIDLQLLARGGVITPLFDPSPHVYSSDTPGPIPRDSLLWRCPLGDRLNLPDKSRDMVDKASWHASSTWLFFQDKGCAFSVRQAVSWIEANAGDFHDEGSLVLFNCMVEAILSCFYLRVDAIIPYGDRPLSPLQQILRQQLLMGHCHAFAFNCLATTLGGFWKGSDLDPAGRGLVAALLPVVSVPEVIEKLGSSYYCPAYYLSCGFSFMHKLLATTHLNTPAHLAMMEEVIDLLDARNEGHGTVIPFDTRCPRHGTLMDVLARKIKRLKRWLRTHRRHKEAALVRAETTRLGKVSRNVEARIQRHRAGRTALQLQLIALLARHIPSSGTGVMLARDYVLFYDAERLAPPPGEASDSDQ
jgi:hypothetical protein